MTRVTNIFWIAFLLFCIPLTFLANESTDGTEKIIFSEINSQQCLKCHGMSNFSFHDPTTNVLRSFTVVRNTFQNSVHGEISCMQCHTDVKEFPHRFSTERKIISCADDCHASDATGKKISHRAITDEFSTSAHRNGLTKKKTNSPHCLDCHNKNPHAIQKAKRAIPPQEKMSLCVSCHENEAMMKSNNVTTDAVSSYKRSFHFKAIKFGETTTAVCQDCHTTHHVLPHDSMQASISSKNIAATCGKNNCHPGAQMNFAMSGANHLTIKIEEEPILKFEEQFFIVLTFGSMAMLVVGIVLDIQKKFGWLILLKKFLQHILQFLFRTGRFIFMLFKKILLD